MKKTTFKMQRLALLLFACGMAPAYAADLPSCAAANYDAARDLFTLNKSNTAISLDHPLKSQIVNQQCLLTVLPVNSPARRDAAAQAGPNRAAGLPARRYVVYLSNGGDGGAGGTQRENGGGGGGAGAVQQRQVVALSPGVYKLTLGAGGPGGNACNGTFGGGPGWSGSPTSIMRVSDGVTVAGAAGADVWARPTRRANDKSAGVLDGHGGTGAAGQASGGAGGSIGPGLQSGAVSGTTDVAGPAGPTGRIVEAGGQPGAGDHPVLGPNIGGGGGGGAGMENGGGGAGETDGRFLDKLAVSGGLGAGGGGGAGFLNQCSAGAPGGNGYIALRGI